MAVKKKPPTKAQAKGLGKNTGVVGPRKKAAGPVKIGNAKNPKPGSGSVLPAVYNGPDRPMGTLPKGVKWNEGTGRYSNARGQSWKPGGLKGLGKYVKQERAAGRVPFAALKKQNAAKKMQKLPGRPGGTGPLDQKMYAGGSATFNEGFKRRPLKTSGNLGSATPAVRIGTGKPVGGQPMKFNAAAGVGRPKLGGLGATANAAKRIAPKLPKRPGVV